MNRSSSPREKKKPGSSREIGEPEFLVVGQLMKPHGLHGDFVMKLHTDFPERLLPGAQVYLGEELSPLHIQTARWYGKAFLIRLEGITTIEAAEGMRLKWVAVRRDDRPALPPGEYYQHELIGLAVLTKDSVPLGYVSQILETGANDVLLVTQEAGGELLIPVIDDVILEIDLDGARIIIDLIPGILPE